MTMNRIGMYAASLDPITVGHLDVIRRAATLFDILVVVVAQNPKKASGYSFDLATRTEMASKAVNGDIAANPKLWRGRGQVLFAANEGKLTARFAEGYGNDNFGFPVKAFVRGIRNAADFDKEMTEFQVTLDIMPDAEFVPLFCKPDLAKVSSSMVKSFVGFEGWEESVRPYLPFAIYPQFVERFQTAEAK